MKASVELWQPEDYSIQNGFRFMEKCGRVCYNSGDRITEGSYKKFCNNIIKSGHTSVAEHMTIYLVIPIGSPVYDRYYMPKHNKVQVFLNSPYSVVKRSRDYEIVDNAPEEYKDFVAHNGPTIIYYITTNYRVLLENFKDVEDLYPYVVKQPTDCHEKRHTFHWTISRGIADEFMRHRALSNTCQSTRYCKIGDTIEPSWFDNIDENTKQLYNEYIEDIMSKYDSMCVLLKKQQARGLLPLDIKTELIQSGTKRQWEEFFKLRCAKDAHPDAQYIASKAKQLIDDTYSNSDTASLSET